MAKTAIDDGLDVGVEEGLKIERRYFTAVLRTEDARRGVSSFLEHGPGHASFVGR
jgi:enoyl-CoA hydratase/carnithine racemase